MKTIKGYFVSGMAFLLPLFITLIFVDFIVELLTKPFQRVFKGVLGTLGIQSEAALMNVSSIIILILLFLLTVFVGALVRWFLAKKLIGAGEYIIDKIPLVNKIYKASKDVIETIVSSPSNSFKQVVVVPYPNKESYSLALLVKESPDECQKILEKDLISVFLPTTPNPTTGFLLMFEREKVVYTSMTVEEALKYIISCGVMLPPIDGEKVDLKVKES